MEKENKYMRSLIENAQHGKIVALEELYGINLDQVHTLVTRLAGNKLIAEAITKNILVRVWEKINEDGPGEMMFSEWIRVLSVKITINELKNPTFLNDKKIKKHLKKHNHTADFSSDPTEKIIAELDLEHRITFVLSKIENYNLSEISNFIGISESEAESLLSESIEKISQAMSEAPTELDLSEHWKNLQEVIDPENTILKSALEEIKEIRTAEIKEEEKENEAERKEEIEELEKAIERERKEKAKAIREKRNWGDILPDFNINKKVVLGGIIAVTIIFLLFQITSSSNNWSVSASKGTPFINDIPVERSNVFATEDIITTDQLSSATIEIPKIGIIEMSKKTKLIRHESELTLNMIRGGIYVNAEDAIAKLILMVPDATINELNPGSSYSVEVDEKGNSTIESKNGWLHVSSENDESLFPEHYVLNVYKNSGLGIPYHLSSSVEYKALLDEYLFGGKRERTLKNIIAASSSSEAISLWNLLTRVDAGHQLENVYYKLAELAPHSKEVTKVDILLLDPDTLNEWLEEIKQQL